MMTSTATSGIPCELRELVRVHLWVLPIDQVTITHFPIKFSFPFQVISKTGEIDHRYVIFLENVDHFALVDKVQTYIVLQVFWRAMTTASVA